MRVEVKQTRGPQYPVKSCVYELDIEETSNISGLLVWMHLLDYIDIHEYEYDIKIEGIHISTYIATNGTVRFNVSKRTPKGLIYCSEGWSSL